MRTITRLTIALSALFCFAVQTANAQNTITFTAQTTTGDGSVVPALTWSTAPAATGCTASGAAGWTGAKGPSGTQTLPAITQSATYNLTCTWPGDTTATVSWVNPTQNTDSSPYTDPLSVRLKYTFAPTMSAGPVCGTGETCIQVGQTPTAPVSTFAITGLTTVGTFRVVAYAQNQRMVFSTGSNEATKVFGGAPQTSRSVGITVNPVPQPVSGVSVL